MSRSFADQQEIRSSRKVDLFIETLKIFSWIELLGFANKID